MDITNDILSAISDAKDPFEFVFNNSIICMKYPYYIMSFRYIKYILDTNYVSLENAHPWKIWDNGYKQFREQDIKLKRKSQNIQYNSLKNRDKIGDPDCLIPLQSVEKKPFIKRISPEKLETDTTGLCILRHDKDTNVFSLKYLTDHLFYNDMNQDARICHCNISPNHFFITYNGFSDKIVSMYYRIFYIPDDFSFIYLYKEFPLLSQPKSIEKNCVLCEGTDNILYWISPDKGFYVKNLYNNTTEIYPTTWKLPTDLSMDNISFSLGTPAVMYKNRWLMAGHVKIDYKKNIKSAAWKEFSELLPWDKIRKHGRYVYMCFFMEFTKNFQITRISDLFFPCQSDSEEILPYTLSFPCGLIVDDTSCILSYGEGDCRTKIWKISTQRLDNKLIPVSKWDKRFKFCFWYEKEIMIPVEKQITHIGYFYEWNCGDDAFMIVFEYLQQKHYPSIKIVFRNTFASDIYLPSIIPRELTIVGGGDIINPFFLDKLIKSRTNMWAVGVGTPYSSYFSYINFFDQCFSRNQQDVERFKELYSPATRFHYIPDLAFFLSDIFLNDECFLQPLESFMDKLGLVHVKHLSNNHHLSSGVRYCIGFCLTRTVFADGYEDNYITFVRSIISIIQFILQNLPDCAIFLIPFCIATNKYNENDCILNKHVKEFFLNNPRIIDIYTQDESYDRNVYVAQTFEWIKRMDMVVVQRFHSHVFSLANHIPFVSITSSRKCIKFCRQYKLEDYLIRLPVNEKDAPKAVPIEMVCQKFINVWQKRDQVRERLQKIHSSIMEDLYNFENEWADRINTFFDL